MLLVQPITAQYVHKNSFYTLNKFYSDTSSPKENQYPATNILKAKKRGSLISLEWQNQPDTLIAAFEIERSSDGSFFRKLGDAVAKNQKAGFVYAFVDHQPLQVNYYRLKMVNEDSGYSYSQEIIVNKSGEQDVAVQPNPFTNSFTVDVYISAAQPIKIQLLNMSGRLLRYKSVSGMPGNNKIGFDDVGSLEKGIYMVRIVRGYSVVEKKIVKNN